MRCGWRLFTKAHFPKQMIYETKFILFRILFDSLIASLFSIWKSFHPLQLHRVLQVWYSLSLVCIIFCTLISIEWHLIFSCRRNESKSINSTLSLHLCSFVVVKLSLLLRHWNQHDSGQTHPLRNYSSIFHFSFTVECIFSLDILTKLYFNRGLPNSSKAIVKKSQSNKIMIS